MNGNLPVNPSHGSAPTVIGTGVTGAPPGTIILLTGRVCLITVNAFALAQCAGSGASGINVVLGGAAATTEDDGTFSLQTPVQAGLVFRVTGDNIVPAAQLLQAFNIIPAFSSSLFDTVLTSNGISISPTMGSVMASVTNSAGQPISGVTATSNPLSASGPFFDGTEPSEFGQNETGTSGIVFFPGLTTLGPASLSFADGVGQESTVDGVQVFDGGVTFVSAPLP